MLACKKIAKVIFPKTRYIDINMMPFIIGDKHSIPEEYRHYYNMVEQCDINEEEYGKIGYLSIKESFVDAGNTHRRGGIHTEKPKKGMGWGGGWGSGKIDNGVVKGGLYFANSVDDSCKIWDMKIDDPDKLGDCDRFMHMLKNEISLKAGELYWLTDETPHQSIPLKESSHRQWFRFVSSQVGIWYEAHSTKNKLGVLPNCQVVYGSKFV